MIVSNLKLTYTLWGFLVFYYNFKNLQSGAITVAFMVALYFLFLYPGFVMVGLLRNQYKIED